MKSSPAVVAVIAVFLGANLFAGADDFWSVQSPDHGQTFAYGMEKHHVWKALGRDQHLALLVEFTNDPFVDWENPRQYDDFTLAFPQVTLGADARTFYYRPRGGQPIAVARKARDFVGLDEIQLLPGVRLELVKPHGYVTARLRFGALETGSE